MLRTTTACNFSSLLWPAGSAPAALASLLFDPPEPQIIGKNTVNRDFPTFSRICIFCLLTLSLLIFSLLIFLFSLPLPCFSSVHIVGSLTSKLPSIMLFDVPIFDPNTGSLSPNTQFSTEISRIIEIHTWYTSWLAPHLFREFTGKRAGNQSEHLDQAPALTLTVKPPHCGHTVWGLIMRLLGHFSSTGFRSDFAPHPVIPSFASSPWSGCPTR